MLWNSCKTSLFELMKTIMQIKKMLYKKRSSFCLLKNDGCTRKKQRIQALLESMIGSVSLLHSFTFFCNIKYWKVKIVCKWMSAFDLLFCNFLSLLPRTIKYQIFDVKGKMLPEALKPTHQLKTETINLILLDLLFFILRTIYKEYLLLF